MGGTGNNGMNGETRDGAGGMIKWLAKGQWENTSFH